MDKLKLIDDMFACSACTFVNLVMIQKAGLNAAIVCNELEQEDNYWNKRRMTQDGWWYTTYQNLIDMTSLSKKQIVGAVNKLVEFGIIKTQPPEYKDGIKVKYYKVDFNAKDRFMQSPFDKSVSRNYSPDKFIKYNKELAKQLGPESTIIIRDMCISYINAAKKNNLIDNEWFECEQTKLSKKCGVTPKTMVEYIKKMIQQEIIETRQASWPKHTYARIDFDKLLVLFGYGSWEELEEFLVKRQQEKEQKKQTKVDITTKEVLKKIEQVSGQKWDLTYGKLASIEARLDEGITLKQLLDVVEYRYKWLVDDDELFEKYFTWDSLVGSANAPSVVKQHLKSIELADKKDKAKEHATAVAKHIIDATAAHAKELGESLDWVIDDKNVGAIVTVLNWEEKFTEAELIQFAINRLDHKHENNRKMNSFSTLFSSKERENMMNLRKSQKRKSKNTNFRFNKPVNVKANNNIDTADGVKSNAYSKADIEKFKAKAKQIESVIDDDVM